ncbi:MAG: nucleoside deaminase [Gemmatimonadaceae bacterium]|nr:nucleoside deaminase [Gemmatimonadaceae bacterium]
MSDPAAIRVELPPWALERESSAGAYRTDEERMRVAIEAADLNVQAGTGGPFGAAIFESASGRLVALGVNSVVRLANSVLHAEMVAFMRAQARVGRYSLAAPGLPGHTLYSSCDPCAMCLGAALWAGVRRIVCGATREDAVALRFDEGPVFPDSYRYLAARGIEVAHGVLRDEARGVLERYRAAGGIIYNA